MKDLTNELKCPKCGGTDFGTGKQSGYGRINSRNFNLGSNILHTICISCGFIVESYAEKPKNFR